MKNGFKMQNLAIGFSLFLNFFFPVFLSADPHELTQAINAVIEPSMTSDAIPGMALAVRYGEETFLLSYGMANTQTGEPITPDTIFDLASITKVFTSTELALLVQKGHMRLNDSIVKFMPDLSKKERAIDKVTLWELATHTSALPRTAPPLNNNKEYTFQDVEAYMDKWTPEYPTGTKYVYSNLAFDILGDALSIAAHQPYETLIEKDILQPLGMNSTEFQVPNKLKKRYSKGYVNNQSVPHLEDKEWPASGALRSTARDMLKFLDANMQLHGPKELVNAMQFAQKEDFKVNDYMTLGLGWQRIKTNGLLIIDKNGDFPGFSTYIGMVPEKKAGVVVLINKSNAKSTEIGQRILITLIEHNTSKP